MEAVGRHCMRISIRSASAKGNPYPKGKRSEQSDLPEVRPGPHLHYEQRLNGSPVKIVWEGNQILYYGTKSYTSKNKCSSSVTGVVHTDSGASVNVRSGPGTSYSIVGSVADGTTVTIQCQVRGETVTGKYGTSNLWDKIGNGKYISDTYVYTGSDGQVAPTCQ